MEDRQTDIRSLKAVTTATKGLRFQTNRILGVKLSWAEEEALRSPAAGTIGKHAMRLGVSAVRGSVLTQKPPPPPTPHTRPPGAKGGKRSPCGGCLSSAFSRWRWEEVTTSCRVSLYRRVGTVVGVGGQDVRREERGGSRGLLSALYYINGDPGRTSIKLCKAHLEEQPRPLC